MTVSYVPPEPQWNTVSFRGKSFRVITGKMHPAYSVATFWEESDFKDKHWNIEPGQVVIDAGASYGAYTLPALAMGAARVYAFEPEPSVRSDLLSNVLCNSWTDRGHLIRLGLWDKTETVDMYSYAPHWPAGTITAPFEMIRLDDWAHSARLQRLDWIKMDIEGAEERAIRGGLETIAKFKPRLIVECHTFQDAGITGRIKGLLDGYEFETVAREPCEMLIARPK
jgi:FkbM family methyltransferase